MQNIKLRFGIRVKELSLTKGYSQELLAELANLDRTYIPGIEAGKKCISNCGGNNCLVRTHA